MSRMCKRKLMSGVALLLLAVCILPASAQDQPFIVVYFDASGTETMDCPGIGVVQELYVFLVNSNAFVLGVDYRVRLPVSLIWLADLANGNYTVLGASHLGITILFNLPRNGSSPLLLQRILCQWACESCDGFEDGYIVVEGNPISPFGCPSYDSFCAVGLTTVVCPTAVAVEETTWGRVKALYAD